MYTQIMKRRIKLFYLLRTFRRTLRKRLAVKLRTQVDPWSVPIPNIVDMTDLHESDIL